MELSLTPGTIVRLRSNPDWGEGRVQSCIGHRLTVSFDDHGKVLIDTRHADVEIVRFA